MYVCSLEVRGWGLKHFFGGFGMTYKWWKKSSSKDIAHKYYQKVGTLSGR